MKIVEQYIHAVTRHLPKEKRPEATKELHATIATRLDELGGSTEAHAKSVLHELGDPEIVARKFNREPRFLIGPKLYGHYLYILKYSFFIGLPIAAVITSFSLLSQGVPNIINTLVDLVTILLGVALQIFFWVTLVFALLEKGGIHYPLNLPAEWTVDHLPKLPKHRDLSRTEAVGDIIFYLFVLSIPAFLVTYWSLPGEFGDVPLFNPEYIPMIYYIIGVAAFVGILKSTYKLLAGKWNLGLVITTLVFNAFFIGLMVSLWAFDNVINPEFLATIVVNTGEQSANIVKWIDWTIIITIAVTSTAYLYDSFTAVRTYLRTRRIKKNA